MTDILSSTKQIYCDLWHEVLMRRSGNDITRAVVTILERIIIDNPDVGNLNLGCDSCVPQNKNH